MEDRNICEEIEFALFSDSELTEEQKNHIDNCEKCRMLLSQISQMKSDLGSLSVPDLDDGTITKAVMGQIAKEKSGMPFPKFKITHHIGTAAAVVIILIAALIIKNPSHPKLDNVEDEGVIEFDASEQNNHVLSGISTEETVNDEEVPMLFMADGLTDTVSENDEAPGSVLRSLPEEQENSGGASPEENKKQKFTAYNYSNNSEAMPLYDEYTAVEEAAPETENGNSDGAAGEKMMLTSPRPSSKPAAGSSGGSSFANTEEETDTASDAITESVQDDSLDAGLFGQGFNGSTNAKRIFEETVLSQNNEDFEYNISILNARLYELYGDAYILSAEKLRAYGIDNEKLVELAPSITDEMLEFYSGILDIFE